MKLIPTVFDRVEALRRRGVLTATMARHLQTLLVQHRMTLGQVRALEKLLRDAYGRRGGVA